MVRDKNGNKVKVEITHVGDSLDIPDPVLPDGMTEEMMVRSLFDTEDEYLDYLWQLEHGVPAGMPVEEIERYIRSRRLNKANQGDR